jgi:photosystem II stability/assembly factor-like uncharacterized protein
LRAKYVLLTLMIVPLVACRLTSPPPSPPTTPTPAPRIPTTEEPTLTPTPLPEIPTLKPSFQTGPLPQVVAAITLGDAPQACVGRALTVDAETGYIYTAGFLNEQPFDGAQVKPCLTVIDPAANQVMETRDLPLDPRFLKWDGGTLHAIGKDDTALVVADASTGEIVAREIIGEEFYNERVVLYSGWAYVGMPETSELRFLPLREDAPVMTLVDVLAFDVADDGRIAVVGGLETTTVAVYTSDGTLLAEREVGPGEPSGSLAFAGQADRIFVTRQLAAEGTGETRYFLDVLDAATLELVSTTEEWITMLTADPSGSRVYARASEDHFVAFDASTGQSLGVVFSIPPSEGFSVYDPREKLHVDPATGRVYTVYTDFDTQTWAAGFDPATPALSADGTSAAEGSTGVADVRVPGDQWTLDSTRERLYFSSPAFLLALDAITLQPVWRLPLSRDPISVAIAPDAGTIFVGDAGGDVHVLDSQTHAEVDILPGVGGTVDVDSAHGWLYAGDEFAGGISVYNLATLDLRGVIPQPGRPTASPADGLVYILEEDVYSGDGATLAVIEGRTTRNAGCNGCSFPTGVVVDPTSGLVHVTTYGVWVGKPGPTGQITLDPATGRAFVARTTGGYRVVYTLAAYADLTLETPLAWRDGLYGQPLYNPATRHLYLTDGSRLLVLDGETLDLIGWLYPSDEDLTPAAVDAQSGAAYFLAGHQVLVLEDSGGRAEAPPPRSVARLPGPIEGIAPLPDGMLFVRAYGRDDYVSRLYRSTDGGEAWEEVRGGLPGAPNDLASAPDGTFYAALVPTAWQAETNEASWGEGVYRSEDGGDTWSLLGRGLAHLRVSRIYVGDDGMVYVLATGMWPEQQNWAVPTIWRLGADDRWSQVEIPEAGPFVDADGDLPYAYTQATQAAWHALTGEGDLYRPWGNELQLSTNAGVTWETIGAGPVDYGTDVLTGAGDPPTLYWLTWEAVYRSTDGGTSWARLAHPALADSEPTAVAVAAWGGEETLFVGTEAGELLVLPAAEADWRRSDSLQHSRGVVQCSPERGLGGVQ